MYSAPPRIGITLPVLAVMVCDLAFGLGRAFAQPQPPKPVLFPIPASVVLERHFVGGPEDANVAGSGGERLVYNNTLGTFAVPLGAGNLLSDDIATTVPGGCKLTRYEFPVVGKVDPAGIGGPYTVDFALYRSCPGSVSVASRPSLIIPGTQGRSIFSDDAPRLISFVAGPNVSLQTNMWLGVSFSRGNAGVVVGAPAMKGFSADSFDYPGFPCKADLGGFPDQPHASFNAEIYADADCPEAFVGYKDDRPYAPPYNPGQNVVFADDIQLGVNGCQVIAYEVAVKGVGNYTFDMRLNCEGPAIPGTEKTFTVGVGTDVKIARLTVDPPVALPQNLWFSAKVNNATAGVIVSGIQAAIGQTDDVIEFVGPNGCEIVPREVLGTGVHGAFSLTITCAGLLPVGGCCDMALLDEHGDAVCREVPQINCPWPPRFSALQPAWVPGATCDADPFPYPCGIAACCFLGNSNQFTCENLTWYECYAKGSQLGVVSWQLGRYCGVGGQTCAQPPCGENPESCFTAHPTPGCNDEACCATLCFDGSDSWFCCSVEWDQVCVDVARFLCACLVSGRIDVDGDGDSDLNDYAGFPGCMDGPNLSVDPNCRVYDLDGDSDIDLVDYSLLQVDLGCPALN